MADLPQPHQRFKFANGASIVIDAVDAEWVYFRTFYPGREEPSRLRKTHKDWHHSLEFTRNKIEGTMTISLTSLTLKADASMLPTEVCMHPDLIDRVRRAFLEADMLRSVHPTTRVRAVIHPFTSVGDEEDVA